MKKIEKFDYNGFGIEFEARPEGVYANATAMCQANEKLIGHWLSLDSTKEYAALVADTYNIANPILSKKGKGGGTWIHEKMVLDLARWISPRFALWCDEKIAELLRTGSVASRPTADERHANRLLRMGKDEKFVALRLDAKAARNILTAVLGRHGVEKLGYATCTRAIYAPLFGGDGSSAFIRAKRGLPKNASIRDSLGHVETAAIHLVEALAAEKIERENLHGEAPCANACATVSRTIGAALVQQKRGLYGGRDSAPSRATA